MRQQWEFYQLCPFFFKTLKRTLNPPSQNPRQILGRSILQAGVDLRAEVDAADKRQGKQKKQRGPAAEQGVQLRPKRRAPVSEVLLVGGATRMPAVRRFVRNMTGLEPRGFTVDPDEVCPVLNFCLLCKRVATRV